MKYDPVSLGKHLRLLRHKNRLSIENLAKEVFSSRQVISDIENGKKSIPIELLYQLSDIYDCNISCLLGEIAEPLPSKWVICEGIVYCKHCGNRSFANQKTKYCGSCGAQMKLN